jgi:hypothetical protein
MIGPAFGNITVVFGRLSKTQHWIPDRQVVHNDFQSIPFQVVVSLADTCYVRGLNLNR